MGDKELHFRDKAAYFHELDALKTKAGLEHDDDDLGDAEKEYRRQSRRFHRISPPEGRPGADSPDHARRTWHDSAIVSSDACTCTEGGQEVNHTGASPSRRAVHASAGYAQTAIAEASAAATAAASSSSYASSFPQVRHPPSTLLRSSSVALPPNQPKQQQQQRHLQNIHQQLPMSTSSLRQRPAKASSGAGRKRKRVADPNVAAPSPSSENPPAGERQIFHGLAFYYIPDNDIARARKVRITKAREHGAVWTRALADATHVIVDDGLRYGDISSIIDADARPRQGPVVVNDKYPLDCIHFKALLNPDQKQYRVPGFPETVPAEEDQEQNKMHAEESETMKHGPARLEEDLKLKPASKRLGGKMPDSSSDPGVSASQKHRHDETSVVEVPKELARQTTAPSAPAAPAAPVVPLPPALAQQQHQQQQSSDELSDYIAIMQQYKDLPIDRDDDSDTKSTASESILISDSDSDSPASGSNGQRARKKRSSSPSSSSAAAPAAPAAQKSGNKSITTEERFACHQGGTLTSHADNPNARTIEVLQAMCDYYTRTNDLWRTLAYRKAISTLRRHRERVVTEEQAFALPNIGRRLAAKIEEITTTDRLRRLDQTRAEPLDDVLQKFLGVYGVGTAQATKWIAQGFRTLQDLKEKAKLTPNQRLGVERYADLATRIPRAEVEALASVVQAEAARIDPDVELIVGGSYRRGAESSGDVDFVITREGTDGTGQLEPFAAALVTALEKAGVIVATLASSLDKSSSSSSSSSSSPKTKKSKTVSSTGSHSKWHGCAVVPGLRDPEPAIWRRVDFLLVPDTERGAALLYFTGNDIFNRSMRLLASRKGMRLNQRGLYRDVMRGPGRVKVTEGQLVESRDERRIFEVLGVRWREPQERWC